MSYITVMLYICCDIENRGWGLIDRLFKHKGTDRLFKHKWKDRLFKHKGTDRLFKHKGTDRLLNKIVYD